MKSFSKKRVVTGVALVAVLALSYVDSALAVNCPANSGDILDSDGDGVLTTAAVPSDCFCDVGYAPDGSNGCQACGAGGTTLIVALDVTQAVPQTTCGGIAPGYYGTATADDTTDANVTPCSTTFSGATAAGITSDKVITATTTTTKLACKTAAGYIISSTEDAADGAITVAQAAAGKFAAGGTALVTANAANKGAAPETAADCTAGTYSAAGAASCSSCTAGTTSAPGLAFCGIVDAGYYGTAGAGTAPAYTGHASVTACSATFSGAAGPGITSPALTTGSNDKTACKTAAGYIITSSLNAADSAITVAQAAAGKYAAGGTALVTDDAANKGTGTETATDCTAGTYSALGAASCSSCAAGTTSAAGAASCTQQSAAAATPIAAAVAAMAMPLLI